MKSLFKKPAKLVAGLVLLAASFSAQAAVITEVGGVAVGATNVSDGAGGFWDITFAPETGQSLSDIVALSNGVDFSITQLNAMATDLGAAIDVYVNVLADFDNFAGLVASGPGFTVFTTGAYAAITDGVIAGGSVEVSTALNSGSDGSLVATFDGTYASTDPGFGAVFFGNRQIAYVTGATSVPVPVPEPGELALFVAGTIGVFSVRRRKQKVA